MELDSFSAARGDIQKSKSKGKYGNLCAVKENPTVRVGIDNLSDDLLIKILSCMSIKEAARTSVLARRWKSLWSFVFGTLQFDFSFDYSTSIGDDEDIDAWEKFVAGVNRVLELHLRSVVQLMVGCILLCRRKLRGLNCIVHIMMVRNFQELRC